MIKYANFISSHTHISQCPKTNMPEYAFIGRSNVGKSSLINMLCDRNSLARISGTPGKTQTINFFEIDTSWYLVDLPGYGYAKVSKTDRAKWEKMIRNYLLKRENLMLTFVLIDSRVSPQKNDIDFLNWLGESFIPFVIIYTKVDKLKIGELEENVKRFETELLKYWTEMPKSFVSSSKSKLGQKEILNYINELNQTKNKKANK